MKGKHVGLYVRVSTMLEGQSTSYEAQLEQEKIIMAHGAASCEVYAERISGSSTARPELDRLLEDCRAGKIDFVYTKNLSRMARNVEYLLKIIRELGDLGVPVYFEEENIRTDKTSNKLLLTILGAVAEMERDNIKEHIRSGLEIKRLSGVPARLHSVPYGYAWNKEAKKVELVPEEAEVVKTIFKWYVAENRSCDRICKQLNREGILKRGHRWERSSLQYILQNPRYKGTVVEGEHEFEGAVPAIIDPLTWEQTNTLLTERKKSARNTRENFQVNRYALSGKILCAECGLRCTRTSRPSPYSTWQGVVDDGNKKIQIWTCISCTDKARYPQHENVPSISEYYLYIGLIKVIAEMMIDGAIKAPETASAELSYSTKLKAYKSKKKQLEKARERVYEAYEKGLYPEERFKRSLLKIEQEEAENTPPTPPDQISYPALEQVDLPEYNLDFSNDPVHSHKARLWKIAYIEQQLLRAFQKENSKREWVEATVEKIVLGEEYTFYVYMKQGPVYEVKAPRRAPMHKRSTGELILEKLEITKVT